MFMPVELTFVPSGGSGRGSSSEQRVLRSLLNVTLSAKEARVVWPEIQEHKWYVSQRLGRDVGLRVAALDYFENIRPVKTKHSRAKVAMGRLRRGALELARLYLAHGNWKAHDGVFGSEPERLVFTEAGSANGR